jgi:hypothetical protein
MCTADTQSHWQIRLHSGETVVKECDIDGANTIKALHEPPHEKGEPPFQSIDHRHRRPFIGLVVRQMDDCHSFMTSLANLIDHEHFDKQ